MKMQKIPVDEIWMAEIVADIQVYVHGSVFNYIQLRFVKELTTKSMVSACFYIAS